MYNSVIQPSEKWFIIYWNESIKPYQKHFYVDVLLIFWFKIWSLLNLNILHSLRASLLEAHSVEIRQLGYWESHFRYRFWFTEPLPRKYLLGNEKTSTIDISSDDEFDPLPEGIFSSTCVSTQKKIPDHDNRFALRFWVYNFKVICISLLNDIFKEASTGCNKSLCLQIHFNMHLTCDWSENRLKINISVLTNHDFFLMWR